MVRYCCSIRHILYLLILVVIHISVATANVNSNSCIEWYLGYSGESCTETCFKESTVCDQNHLEGIINIESFGNMVPLATQLGTEVRLPPMTEFCNGGVNTWPFATAPAVTAYHIHEKNELDSTRMSTLHYNCYFPSKMIADCDTKFQVPAAQRFCACLNTDCVSRKRLRGKIYSKF